MKKSILLFLWVALLFSACKKDVIEEECFECETLIRTTGNPYANGSTITTSNVCGIAQRDTLLKTNGTSTTQSADITITVTQTTECRPMNQ